MNANKDVLRTLGTAVADTKHFRIRMVGPGLYQAFSIETNQSISPRYTNRDACEYYVEREEKALLEEAIDGLLGESRMDEVP